MNQEVIPSHRRLFMLKGEGEGIKLLVVKSRTRLLSDITVCFVISFGVVTGSIHENLPILGIWIEQLGSCDYKNIRI